MVWVALLCLLCRASELAHLTLAPHVLCAAHGELMDVRPVEGKGASVEPDAHDHSRPGVDSRTPALVMVGHEHCSLAAHLRGVTLAFDSGPLLPARTSVVELAGMLREAAAASRRALLLKAPKNSPPA
jgi:hypothetical protein